MNLLVLDSDPDLAARYLFDRHVVPQFVDCLQLLSEAWHRHCAVEELPPVVLNQYRPQHLIARWVGDCQGNYIWTVMFATALCYEQRRRWPRNPLHRGALRLQALQAPPAAMPSQPERTGFVQCMPERYKGGDSIAAYRRFYATQRRKQNEWSNKLEPPIWMSHNLCAQ